MKLDYNRVVLATRIVVLTQFPAEPLRFYANDESRGGRILHPG